MRLLFRTLAIGIAYCVIHVQTGCTKPQPPAQEQPQDSLPEVPKPRPTVKKRLLTSFYTTNGYATASMEYDSLGKIIAFADYYRSGYKVFYNSDTTLHYVLEPLTSVHRYERKSWIFLYDTNKRCIKVITKKVESYNAADAAENNPVFTNTNDRFVSRIDSLIYSPSGQLTEIWNINPISYNYVQFFKYSDAGQADPAEIDGYYGPGFNVANMQLQDRTLFTYTDKDQPASKSLWWYSFILPAGYYVYVVPSDPGTSSRQYWLLFKKAIKHYTTYYESGNRSTYKSKNFVYEYNKDSTIFKGRCDPDDIVFDWFHYRFTVKDVLQ